MTDATFAFGGNYYYNIVTGSAAGGGSFGDFHARFPAGASIGAGEYQTIAMDGTGFHSAYGFPATYELFDTNGAADMREALAGSINGQGGLSDGGEFVVLYEWDDESDLVRDVDYAVWGDKDEAVDKTGVSIDGPDPDGDASTYLADTAISAQAAIASGAHSSGNSFQRLDLVEGVEGTESGTGGNGILDDDETSENLDETWLTAVVSPGSPYEPPPPPDEVCGDPFTSAHAIQGSGFSSPLSGAVAEFLSYEGEFEGVGGPADGIASTDVGVSETGSTLAGSSLQLTGNGVESDDFVWGGPISETRGSINSGQMFAGFPGVRGRAVDQRVPLRQCQYLMWESSSRLPGRQASI